VLLLQFLKIKKKALAFKRRKSYLYPFDCKFLREATGILWDVSPFVSFIVSYYLKQLKNV